MVLAETSRSELPVRRCLVPLRSLVVVATLLILQGRVNACAVCFGDPDSEMTKGAFAGVLVLFLIIASVLGGIIFTAVYWTQRSRKLVGFQSADLH